MVTQVPSHPDSPFSMQIKDDYSYVNPFADAKKSFKKQKLIKRLYLTHVYNRIDKTTRKASRTNKKYFGKTMYKFVNKSLKTFNQPLYAGSLNYQRAGTTIVLRGDADYYKLYPDNRSNYFIHHMPDAYYYLISHWSLVH